MVATCRNFQASTSKMTAGLSARYVRNSSDLHPFYQETHVHFPQVVLDSPSQFEVPWGGNFDIIILVDSPSHFEVARGLVMLISSHPCGHSKSN